MCRSKEQNATPTPSFLPQERGIVAPWQPFCGSRQSAQHSTQRTASNTAHSHHSTTVTHCAMCMCVASFCSEAQHSSATHDACSRMYVETISHTASSADTWYTESIQSCVQLTCHREKSRPEPKPRKKTLAACWTALQFDPRPG